MPISQSIAWWCFVPNKLSPEQFVKAAASIGYSAIELAPPEHWQMIKDYGLALSSVGAHGPLSVGFNRAAQHAALERDVAAALTQAVKWQIPSLIVFSGDRAGLSDEAGAEASIAGLKRVAPLAESAGVTLVLELLNSKVDHPDYQCDHTAWGARVINAVNSPRVKLLYDIYHMQIMEGDVMRTIGEHHTAIAHYHTAGNPGRNEIDDTQEIYYPPILRAIAATGYSGYIVHEFLPKGDAIAGMRHAFDLTARALA